MLHSWRHGFGANIVGKVSRGLLLQVLLHYHHSEEEDEVIVVEIVGGYICD